MIQIVIFRCFPCLNIEKTYCTRHDPPCTRYDPDKSVNRKYPYKCSDYKMDHGGSSGTQPMYQMDHELTSLYMQVITSSSLRSISTIYPRVMFR